MVKHGPIISFLRNTWALFLRPSDLFSLYQHSILFETWEFPVPGSWSKNLWQCSQCGDWTCACAKLRRSLWLRRSIACSALSKWALTTVGKIFNWQRGIRRRHWSHSQRMGPIGTKRVSFRGPCGTIFLSFGESWAHRGSTNALNLQKRQPEVNLWRSASSSPRLPLSASSPVLAPPSTAAPHRSICWALRQALPRWSSLNIPAGTAVVDQQVQYGWFGPDAP